MKAVLRQRTTVMATVAAALLGCPTAAGADAWSEPLLLASGAGEQTASAVGADGTVAVAWTERPRNIWDSREAMRVHVRMRSAGGRLGADRALGTARGLGGAAVTPNGTAAVFSLANANDPAAYRWIARSDTGWTHIVERNSDRDTFQLLPLRDGRLLEISGGSERFDYVPMFCTVGRTKLSGCRSLGTSVYLAPETAVEAGKSIVAVGQLEDDLRSLNVGGAVATPLARGGKPTTRPFDVQVASPSEYTSDLDARGGILAWASAAGGGGGAGLYYAVGRGDVLDPPHRLPWVTGDRASDIHIVADAEGGATLVWTRTIADSRTGRPHWARIAADGTITAHGALDRSTAVDNLDLAKVGKRTVAVWQVHRHQAHLRSAEITSGGPVPLALQGRRRELLTIADRWSLSAAGHAGVLVRSVGGLLWMSSLAG